MNDEHSTPDPPPPPATPPPPVVPPPGPPPPGYVSQNRSMMIVLSYLWLLALVPFLAEKEDAVVQWHAKHGLVLLVAEIALFLLVSIVGSITGFLSCLLVPLLYLAIFVLHGACIVKGVNGGRLIVPMVSEYADRL